MVFNHYAYAQINLNLSATPPHQILILKSKESSFYKKTILAIKNTLVNNYDLRIENIDVKPKLNGASLVITMGVTAANYARKNYPNTPKIFSFVSLKQSLNLQIKPRETHLLIELQAKHYLSFAKTILPNKTIGILYQKDSHKQLANLDKNLSLIEVTEYNKVISATRSIIKSSDVLLALPNKNIFNRHSLKGILLSTYQSNTPLVSYSPAHVKAGAVAAIYASPSNLGSHIVEMIQNSFNPSNALPQRQFAKHFSIKINRRVAQSLGLILDDNDDIYRLVNAQISHD